MCSNVSRIEPNVPNTVASNCSGFNSAQRSSRRRFAQRWWSNKVVTVSAAFIHLPLPQQISHSPILVGVRQTLHLRPPIRLAGTVETILYGYPQPLGDGKLVICHQLLP